MIINIMFWILFLLILGMIWPLLIYPWMNKASPKMRKTRQPPGPPGLPLIGNLHMLGELPHHELCKLAKQYGPIMYLRLGSVSTIIISSPHAAEQFFKVHDLSFISRPSIASGKYMSYGSKGLTLCKYGSYWRNIRKLCMIHLLSQTKIEAFKSMRKEELGLLTQSIRDSSRARATVNLSDKSASLTADMTCRMVFGRKYTDADLDAKGFRGVIGEVMKLAISFNIADYIPYVGVLDLQGLTSRMKAVSKVLDVFFEKIIDEHIESRELAREKGEHHQHQDDFVDVMLSLLEANDSEFRMDRTNIKAIMLDMLAGGMDTSATAIEWTLSELLRNPSIMKKVQEELEMVVGKERFVEESDLPRLEYMDMVVKETMRLHPVAPLPFPREAVEDCEIDGYHIPRKTRMIANVYAIGRDSNAWVDAEKFYPERFIGTTIDLKGHDFQLLPFGSGRRGCPGMQLGLTMVRLMVAQLVHCFDWVLPFGTSPSNLDMREASSLIVGRATHLLAIPTFRLSSNL